jgi:unsaturated rhamnogalacturonyl hydrolase
MLAAMIERFDFVLAHPIADNLVFDRTLNPDWRNPWSWCDALFMGPPAWGRLYAATGKKAYLDFAVEKWWKGCSTGRRTNPPGGKPGRRWWTA